MKKEEKESLEKLIAEHMDSRKTEILDDDSGIDYAEEYRKQTGKDFDDGKYVTQ